MLNWMREKLFGRQSNSRVSSVTSSASDYSTARSTMNPEQRATHPNEKLTLHIIFEGEILVISVDREQLISNLINMAISHFFDPKETHRLTSKYKFISVSRKRVLHPQCTVGDEELKNDDEILLAASMSTGATVPLKLSLQDIKGPTKEDIIAATVHITKQNPIQLVPVLECQENFQSEIRKVLYTLVEASANILAQSPDAKIIFDAIAVRINAKNKKEIDKNAIKYLKDLGFTEAQAIYALQLKRNRQIEAMEWLLENSHRVKEDSSGGADVASTSADTSPPTAIVSDDPRYIISKLLKDIRDFHQRHFEPSPKSLEILQSMGFNQDDVVEALRLAGNNQIDACEWLCGERDLALTKPDTGLDKDGLLYKALMDNAAIQLGLHNPKIMLAFLSILENPSSANLWLNDIDTAPVLGQVFKTYHSEKHIMVVNQQMELIQRQHKRS